MKNIIVKATETDTRLDVFLTQCLPENSRNFITGNIRSGKVLINNEVKKPSYNIKLGDVISLELAEKESSLDLKAENISLDIIYEDENVIVVNKRPGMVVHPAAGNYEGTLVNALLYHFPKIEDAVFEEGNPISISRPGLVHRLDKDTSGIIIVAKNARAMHSLSKQIQNRNVTKIYKAICYNWPKNPDGKLVNFLGRHPENRKMVADIGESKGRQAISHYKTEHFYEDKDGNHFSEILFDIKTGRTHQIRVQSKIMGCPVMGDEIYGNKTSLKLSDDYQIKRQLLHAYSLSITLPGDNRQTTFVAPVPNDFESFLSNLTEIASL
ncbi:MAG: RluA family pseudouridine synthase [Candidatus Berkelbacteria bacterium]|nr:RluA family pseudouridine synthase [Candidatus Berkelbacteria bacterium]